MQNLSQLSYVSPSGIFGSYVAISINVVILCLTFWTSLWPVGSDGISISSFLEVYVGIPFFWFLVLIYKLILKTFIWTCCTKYTNQSKQTIEQYFILNDSFLSRAHVLFISFKRKYLKIFSHHFIFFKV